MDAERERAGLRGEKPRSQSITIGVCAREHIGFELTQFQLLDISRGLSFLHALEIVHGDLKGVRFNLFPRIPRLVEFSPSPTPGEYSC